MSDSLTVAVIGSGPAGLSAALWAQQLGYAPVVIEAADEPGGTLRYNFLPNEWVLGLPGLTGTAMSAQFVTHIAERQIPLLCNHHVTRLIATPQGWRLHFPETPEPLAAAAVILATGLRFRGPESFVDVAGIETLAPDEIAFGPYAFCHLDACRDKTVLIVGCGDNGFENAKMVLEAGGRTILLCRSTPRAQRHLREAVACYPDRAQIYRHARLRALRREGSALVATWHHGDCALDEAAIDRLHLLLGYTPNIEGILAALGDAAEALHRDAEGYLVTDAWGRTALPRLYAAGDVANRDFPNVVSAIASGAKAAKAVDLDLGRC